VNPKFAVAKFRNFSANVANETILFVAFLFFSRLWYHFHSQGSTSILLDRVANRLFFLHRTTFSTDGASEKAVPVNSSYLLLSRLKTLRRKPFPVRIKYSETGVSGIAFNI
jgi:hypothetical protein